MCKYLFALFLLLSSVCKSQNENYVTGLSGAYSMLSQSLEGSNIDTTFTERKQLKIYTDHYMMYVRLDLDDSLSSFGVGRFSINKGRLTERIIYSASDTIENTNSFSGTVNISKRLKGYEQVIPQIMSDKGKVRLTEDYQLLPPGSPSSLDGIWKLSSAYTIEHNDTIQKKTVKYKAYYRGNFSSGNFTTNSAGEHHTMVEYGTFHVNGKSKLKENITYSTSSSKNGQPYDLNIFIKGNNYLILKFTNASGIEEMEKYIRMK